MKKKIYLKDESFNWKEYEYSTIDELKEEFTKRRISIGKGASIGNGASIGYDTSIGNRASIGHGASIGDYASIGDRASIGDDASIGNRASIGYGASIGYDASIGNSASIGDRASIGYDASIGNGIKLLKNFYIVGSKHLITYTGNNTLSIGCHNFTIDKWKECFKTVGEKENYSNEQIEEYYQYILMAEQFAKIG